MFVVISLFYLLLGVITGILGQRSRICFIGGFRDYFIIRDKDLIMGVFSFFVTIRLLVLLFQLIGIFSLNWPSLIAIWNNSFIVMAFIGAVLLGYFATLSGSCPLRHYVQMGQGNTSSMWFALGMLIGIILFYWKIIELISYFGF